MAHTKNTARGVAMGLPRARFERKDKKEKKEEKCKEKHQKPLPKIHMNAVPSDSK